MSPRALQQRLRYLGPCFAVAVLLPEQQVEAESKDTLSSKETLSVVVSSPRCEADSFPLMIFLDSLRVELTGGDLHCCTLVEPGDVTYSKASLHVSIAQLSPCGTELEGVRIAVQKPDRARALEREISLSDVEPSARPRALALAVAELIRLLRQDERDEPPTPVHGAPQPAVIAPKQPQPEIKGPTPTHRTSVGYAVHIEADGRHLPTRHTNLWGGRGRFTVNQRYFHADFDLGANYSNARVDLGDVGIKSASVGLGLGPRLVTRLVIIDLGLRAEWGWAWIRGKAAFSDVQTGTGSGMHSSAGFRFSVEGPMAQKIRPGLALESGTVLRSINGDVNGQAETGIAGYYLLVAAGIGVSL